MTSYVYSNNLINPIITVLMSSYVYSNNLVNPGSILLIILIMSHVFLLLCMPGNL